MRYKALKAHYCDGRRRQENDIFDLVDSDMIKTLTVTKCIEEVIDMAKGSKKGGKGGKKGKDGKATPPATPATTTPATATPVTPAT
jgi:hypothetical protein